MSSSETGAAQLQARAQATRAEIEAGTLGLLLEPGELEHCRGLVTRRELAWRRIFELCTEDAAGLHADRAFASTLAGLRLTGNDKLQGQATAAGLRRRRWAREVLACLGESAAAIHDAAVTLQVAAALSPVLSAGCPLCGSRKAHSRNRLEAREIGVPTGGPGTLDSAWGLATLPSLGPSLGAAGTRRAASAHLVAELWEDRENEIPSPWQEATCSACDFTGLLAGFVVTMPVPEGQPLDERHLRSREHELAALLQQLRGADTTPRSRGSSPEAL